MAIIKKYLSKDKTIRLASMVSTPLVQESVANQEISALALVTMGRLLTGTVLMASHMKEHQQIGVYMRGDGPLGQLFAEASYNGPCRSFCANRVASLEPGQKVGDGIGKGFLEVVRDLPFQKEPHRGTVAIQTGEVADDLVYYLRQSQQVPAIMGLSVSPSEEGCEAAGGYLLELMPGCTEDTIDLVERIVKQVPPIGTLVRDGAQASDIVSDFLLNIPFDEIEHPHPIQYKCRCSLERMERSLLTLGEAEIQSLLRANEMLEITCEFCGKLYEVHQIQLQRLLNSLRK